MVIAMNQIIMPKPNPNTGYRISMVLQELSGLFWELEVDEKAEHIKYTRADVMNAVKVYSHVLSNVAIHRAIDNGEKDPHFMRVHGDNIAKLTKEMTGVDTKKYYKKT